MVLLPRQCLNIIGLGCSAFARHYLRNHFCFLLLWVLRCFSSPRLPSLRNDRPSTCRVAPFGNHGINCYLHIPRAYRSLSRPSSPPRAMGIHRLPFPTFLPSSFGVSPSGLRILLDSLFVIFFVLLVQHVNDLFSSPCGACGE